MDEILENIHKIFVSRELEEISVKTGFNISFLSDYQITINGSKGMCKIKDVNVINGTYTILPLHDKKFRVNDLIVIEYHRNI